MPPIRAPPTHSRPPPGATAPAPPPPSSRRTRRRPCSSFLLSACAPPPLWPSLASRSSPWIRGRWRRWMMGRTSGCLVVTSWKQTVDKDHHRGCYWYVLCNLQR
uniref:Uncharacterized protein n=1 Tax=Triticum urartu TaxID=4572 RepID=A0A8R7U1M7_TRIUA